MRSRKPADAAPARMGALAKLPIFLDLQGKRAVLAGGSAAACWKAELLEAAGATVHVYALELSAEMAERITPDGRIIHHARPWAMDVFDGAAIALADLDGDEEARAFYCAGRAAGVPVNVIDKPAFCQFQFGSIVNRSPVIIGISTDGAAPSVEIATTTGERLTIEPNWNWQNLGLSMTLTGTPAPRATQ